MRGNVVGHVRLVLALGLAGCSTGNRGSIRHDTSVRNERGTIALSDPKLYSRENLINERARDVAWIDGLIVASEDPTKVVFKPALLREMEEISAFSAALGEGVRPESRRTLTHEQWLQIAGYLSGREGARDAAAWTV